MTTQIEATKLTSVFDLMNQLGELVNSARRASDRVTRYERYIDAATLGQGSAEKIASLVALHSLEAVIREANKALATATAIAEETNALEDEVSVLMARRWS